MAKVLFVKTVLIDGVPTETLFAPTTPAGNQGLYVRSMAGVGNKFWWFASIPAGQIASCDFTDAPTVSSDVAANNAAIAAITVSPTDVITYV